MTDPRLLSIATAVPAHGFRQEEVRERIPVVFPNAVKRWSACCRCSSTPASRPGIPACRSTGTSMTTAGSTATNCTSSIRRRCWKRRRGAALNQASMEPADIDGIVVASTTGVATPSLDAMLMERMDFRRDIPVADLRPRMLRRRVGSRPHGAPRPRCAAREAPVPGGRAVRADLPPQRPLEEQHRRHRTVRRRRRRGPGRLRGRWAFDRRVGRAHLAGDARRDGLGRGIDGLRVIFSRDIPSLIRERFRPVLDDLLDQRGLGARRYRPVALPPRRREGFGCIGRRAGVSARHALRHSRAVLRDYGNMSAVTVMFVLAARWRTAASAGAR